MTRKRNLLMLVMIVFGLSLLSSTVYSQDKQKKTPEEFAKMRSEKMSTTLSLDENQKSQIYQLFLDQHSQWQKDKETYKNDKESFKKLRKENRETMKSKMQSILTTEQYTKWQEHKKSKHEKHKGKKKLHKKHKKDKSE